MHKKLLFAILLLGALLTATAAQASLWDQAGAGTFYNDDLYIVDLTSIGLTDGQDYQFSLTFTPLSDQAGDGWEASWESWTDFLTFQVVDGSGVAQESFSYSDISGAGSSVTRTFNFNYTSGTDSALWTYLQASGDNTVENWVHTSATITPLPGALWLLGAGLVGLFGLRRRFSC